MLREHSIALEPGAKITVPLFAKIGQLKSDCHGHISRRRRTARHPRVRHRGRRRAGRHSAQRAAVDRHARRAVERERRIALAAAQHDGRQLAATSTSCPIEWWGYEGVDAVILATADDEISTQLSTASPQLAALEQWVRMGGRLIMSVGRQAQRVLASGAPLGKSGAGNALERSCRCGRARRWKLTPKRPSRLVAAARSCCKFPSLTGVRGKIEAYAGNRRARLAAGGAHAARLWRGGVRGDRPRAGAACRLGRARSVASTNCCAAPERPATEADESGLGQVTTLGFVDLAGQLRGALDQFAGVQLVPFWLVAVLVAAYISVHRSARLFPRQARACGAWRPRG